MRFAHDSEWGELQAPQCGLRFSRSSEDDGTTPHSSLLTANLPFLISHFSFFPAAQVQSMISKARSRNWSAARSTGSPQQRSVTPPLNVNS